MRYVPCIRVRRRFSCTASAPREGRYISIAFLYRFSYTTVTVGGGRAMQLAGERLRARHWRALSLQHATDPDPTLTSHPEAGDRPAVAAEAVARGPR